MGLTIEEALLNGVTAHKEGKLHEAEGLYRGILRSHPTHPDANHNLGVLAVSLNNADAALPLFKAALKANPKVEQFWLSYIDALIKLKQFENARQAIQHAREQVVDPDRLRNVEAQLPPKNPGLTTANASPPQELIETLLGHYQEGQFNFAENLSIEITRNFPNYPFAWKVLGAILKQTARLREAVDANQTAVMLSPNDAEAHNNLGATLHDIGRLEEAKASYSRAIALKDDYAEAHSNLGITLQELGKLSESEVSFREAIALQPDYAEAYNNLGVTLKELRRLEESEDCYRQAVALNPDYAEAHSNLGNTLKELERFDEAELSCIKAIALAPKFAAAHSNLGSTLQELGRLDEAEASYLKALRLEPNFTEAHYNLGSLLKEQGRLNEAETCYRQAIALKPDFTEAHLNITTIKTYNTQDKQFLKMLELSLDNGISEEQRSQINFGLAKAYEDLNNIERAYAHYTEANALRKILLDYDISQDVRLFKEIRSNYPMIKRSSFRFGDSSFNLIPVFIVGMPRSGTTLVEQIISSHSQVTGAGELSYVERYGSCLANGSSKVNSEDVINFRNKYFCKISAAARSKHIVTDKMPQNFRYIGLLAAAFPEAKIVHVKRNPAAVCWANYTQHFISENIGYCYAMDDVISYYGLYEELMGFWKNNLSDRIYELDYEKLTVTQESETRQLIDYLDIEWDQNCLSPQHNSRSVTTASSVQIRKKVYQGSSERWKKYRPYLNGALDGLQAV